MATLLNRVLVALGILVSAQSLVAAPAQHIPSPYLRDPLSNGVTCELPRNWTAITGNSRVTMEAAVTALVGPENMESAELPFAANLYDDRHATIGIFNIRFYPDFELGQADVQAL